MKTIMVLACLGALVTAGVAEAGTITFDFGAPVLVTTTAGQDAKLAGLVARDNAGRAEQGKAARTVEQYLRDVMVSAVQSYVRQVNEAEAQEACAGWDSIGPAVKAQVISAFGGKIPCR